MLQIFKENIKYSWRSYKDLYVYNFMKINQPGAARVQLLKNSAMLEKPRYVTVFMILRFKKNLATSTSHI